MFGRLLRWYTIYTFSTGFAANGFLPAAKFTLRPNTAYWHRYCMALEHWALAKLCGIEQMAPPIFDRAAITLGIGLHSSYHFK